MPFFSRGIFLLFQNSTAFKCFTIYINLKLHPLNIEINVSNYYQKLNRNGQTKHCCTSYINLLLYADRTVNVIRWRELSANEIKTWKKQNTDNSNGKGSRWNSEINEPKYECLVIFRKTQSHHEHWQRESIGCVKIFDKMFS